MRVHSRILEVFGKHVLASIYFSADKSSDIFIFVIRPHTEELFKERDEDELVKVHPIRESNQNTGGTGT